MARRKRTGLAKKPATEQQATERYTPHLLSLPQELQDDIFSLAYGTDIPRIRTRSEWEISERTNYKDAPMTYIMRPCPTFKVQEFLVSKRYFIAAANAYVNAHNAPEQLLLVHDEGIAYGFATTYSTYSLYTSHLPPRTKTYEVFVDVSDFNGLPNKNVLRDDLSDDEIRSARCFEVTTAIRANFNSFRARIPAWRYDSTAEDKETLQRNIARLERLVMAHVSEAAAAHSERGSEPHTFNVNRDALYPGSLVRLTSNTLLNKVGSALENNQVAAAPRRSKLRLEDIPDTTEGLRELVSSRSEDMAAWVRGLKKLMLN